eukprot:GHRR01033046.1.p1 GENE.GHRR01033046.1~~GHRR01033046.1.p1  ORF type:complete len:252 (+),score=104.38 GHRR01033046.1:970-1725(+)
MQHITQAFSAVSKQVIDIESCLSSEPVGCADMAGLLRQVQELEKNKLKLTLSWQALRAAHAAGRFSWQAAADRPRLQGTRSEQQLQQQRQIPDILQGVQFSGRSAVTALHGNAPAKYEQSSSQVEGCMTVKPGFYEQQLQDAMTAAAAAEQPDASSANGQAEAFSVSNGSYAEQMPAGGHQHSHHAGCCSHQHHHEPPDPLDSNELEPTEAEYKAAVEEAVQKLDICVTGINEVLEEVRYAVQELQDEQQN